ncbi:titin-like isoform X2 [Bolinopsis microptera]|uniref:titin-like isoform X2 n=1 Tax=Bolinopsis microptera TaxID=2820187 RepID=UPI003078C68D
MNRSGKINKSADRRRREAGFDLSAASIAKHTQPSWSSCMISRNKVIPNEELHDFLKRLNYLYARELEEIELKADVAKLIASGEIENTQEPVYDLMLCKQAVPRYVPPRTKCRRPPPHINSMEHKQIVNLTAQAISQYEKAAKKGKTPPVLCRSKSTSSSPSLVQYTGPSTHLINIAYGSGRRNSKPQKKPGYSPLKQPEKTKKIPVRFERPISAPPKYNLGSDSEPEDADRGKAWNDDAVRVPSTMTEEDSSDEGVGCYPRRVQCTQPEPPLIVRLDKKLPEAIVQRKKSREAAVVLREKRKKDLVNRRQEELALERKLRFRPRYMEVNPPKTSPPPKPSSAKKRTNILLNNPRPPSVEQTAAQFSQLNLDNLSSMETGLTQEDIQTFVRQSKLTRDMLNINVNKGNLSLVFDEKSLQCEKMLRREIQKYKSGKNPTYCII